MTREDLIYQLIQDLAEAEGKAEYKSSTFDLEGCEMWKAKASVIREQLDKLHGEEK